MKDRLHCPNCGERVPKDDRVVCPHCGSSLDPNYINQRLRDSISNKIRREEEGEVFNRRIDRARSKEKKYHRKVGYYAIVGGALAALGFGIALTPPLFWEGLISIILGGAILMFCMIYYGYSSEYASRQRIKQGKVMTVGDAMRLGVYYPPWLKWWIPLIPFNVFIIVGAVHLIPWSLAWFLFFVYGGSLMLYQYIYARRWLAKYQTKEFV